MHIDSNSLSKEFQFKNRFNALYSSVVRHEGNIIKRSDIVRMPKSIFEQKWWANRDKGENDIKNFSFNI